MRRMRRQTIFCTRCHYIQTPWILWTPLDVEHRLAVEQQNPDDERAVLEASIVTEDLDTLGACDHLSHDRGTKSKLPHVTVILWSATITTLCVLQCRITTLGKRYRCRCQCGCTKRPGRLVQCCVCGARVGPGCCLDQEYGDNGLCHLCHIAQPEPDTPPAPERTASHFARRSKRRSDRFCGDTSQQMSLVRPHRLSIPQPTGDDCADHSAQRSLVTRTRLTRSENCFSPLFRF